MIHDIKDQLSALTLRLGSLAERLESAAIRKARNLDLARLAVELDAVGRRLRKAEGNLLQAAGSNGQPADTSPRPLYDQAAGEQPPANRGKKR